MKLSYETIRTMVLERYQDSNIYDYCDEYGEPGYTFPTGATTPLVLLGDYWCRCDKFGADDHGRNQLHGIDTHHPRVWKQLEDQGVQLEWHDEWITDHNSSKCYRTSGDSYGWQPSILWGEGDFLTPDDGLEAWVDEVANHASRCLPRHLWSDEDIAAQGFREYKCGYENGWHPGQTDDPGEIDALIREELGTDVDVMFQLSDVGQFDIHFCVWVRGDEPAREAISSNHYSVDLQLEDAASWLEHNEPDQFASFLVAFPEWPARTMSGSWFDVEEMEVDQEWSSWAIDWIEANTAVQWEEGEPYAPTVF